MSLPLPRVVSDVGPGGPLTTALRGMNAFQQENAMRRIKEAEAQYAPQTVRANAMSKLAYANLMGPQFISKLMQNPEILANLPEEQKRELLQHVTAAGSLQPSNPFNQNMEQLSQKRAPNSIVDMLKGILGINPNPQQINAQPNESPQFAEQGMSSSADQLPLSAQQVNALQQRFPNAVKPIEQENSMAPPSSWAENVGIQKGIQAEGAESGKIRAKDIKDLNDVVFNGQTKQASLDNVSKILSSPEFEEMRQNPLAGHHELSYYSKFGTPKQQNMVGQYYSSTGDIIKSSARDFAGQFRKGEQQLLSGMKPNPSDTVEAARGKLESLSVMNRLLTERARMTSKIMSHNHVNKLEAEETADKLLDGNQIRREIHDALNPTITLRNKKTGEIKTVTQEEARKLRESNV